jgi:hypothetical protein
MTPQDYYRLQSPITDPGAYAFIMDALPDDIEELCRVVRGIYIHFRDEKVSPGRMWEVELRHVASILEQALALNDRSLIEEREPKHRVVGCCRDAALILCSMLRHKGIPARLRMGFAPYYLETTADGQVFSSDHVITEYWDGQQWRLVDTEKFDGLDFDIHHIPRDRFLVGGNVWQLCRRGAANPDNFGHGPGDSFTGWWAVREGLLRDLAALNKVEVLLWDAWGWLDDFQFEQGEEETILLDRLAELTQGDDSAFDTIQTLYANDARLRAPPTLMCYSPFVEPYIINWHEPCRRPRHSQTARARVSCCARS